MTSFFALFATLLDFFAFCFVFLNKAERRGKLRRFLYKKAKKLWKMPKLTIFRISFVHHKSFKTTSVWKWEYVNKIMFSALKSKLSSTPSPTANDKSTDHGNHGINSMNAALQRKFARGVHYNLKLLLRGDRNTGKSCLFKRLQVK